MVPPCNTGLVWNTKRDKNRNHELCERGSDRAALGLENCWVGTRELLCWDDRTALVLEYHCQGRDDRTTHVWARQSPTRESRLAKHRSTRVVYRESRLAKHRSTRVVYRESRLAKHWSTCISTRELPSGTNRGKVYTYACIGCVCSPHARIIYSCGTKYWIENGDSERLEVVKGECSLASPRLREKRKAWRREARVSVCVAKQFYIII